MIDYASYLRRVSKYDLDRGTLDFQRLQREKHRDRTENVKIKRKQWERGLAHKKKKEAEEEEEIPAQEDGIKLDSEEIGKCS